MNSYLDLMEACLTGMIYQDAGRGVPYCQSVREIGGDWPRTAHTMIGTKRLHQLRLACEDVIARNIPGNFIECGVWRGGACIMMKAVLAYHNQSMRTVYVADSFEGFPPLYFGPDRILKDHFSSDDLDYLKVSLEEVERNFKAYGLYDSGVSLNKIWFNQLSELNTGPLAILRADGDLYQSTMDILSNLYSRLSPGGYCIIDDYGAMIQCRQAVHEFRDKHHITENIIEIDHSGIYWIKG